MRILFVNPRLSWPRQAGQDVHTYYTMRALVSLGHEVALATLSEPNPQAIAGLDLCRLSVASLNGQERGAAQVSLSYWQERFRSYWGVQEEHIRFVGAEARRFRADAVVVVGLEVLPYLAAVEDCVRVWYAADEWLWHHLSLVQVRRLSSWSNLRSGLIKGLYERTHRNLLDRAWVVSTADRRALRMVSGLDAVDVVPNGVDTDHYRDDPVSEIENSCTFWGRLDFAPNVQALEWFCQQVWPKVRREVPNAQFRIFGFSPTRSVEELTQCPGVSVTPDLPDIRGAIAQNQVAVFPIQSGGGVKNKVLEAASMARPIICSQRACNGLALSANPPFTVARDVQSWVRGLVELWKDGGRRRQFGASARRWVKDSHCWLASARVAASGLEESMRGVPA